MVINMDLVWWPKRIQNGTSGAQLAGQTLKHLKVCSTVYEYRYGVQQVKMKLLYPMLSQVFSILVLLPACTSNSIYRFTCFIMTKSLFQTFKTFLDTSFVQVLDSSRSDVRSDICRKAMTSRGTTSGCCRNRGRGDWVILGLVTSFEESTDLSMNLFDVGSHWLPF